MLVKDLFLLVSSKLQDLDTINGQRWPWEKDQDYSLPSLIDFLNNGLRQIVLNRPDATAITEPIQLEPNKFKQSIPDPSIHQGASKKAVSLLDMSYNMGTDGKTRTSPIFNTSVDEIKSYFLNGLHSSTEINNYAYDKLKDPNVFYIYPILSVGNYVEITYSAEPDTITSPDEELPISDIFSTPLMHWILYEVFVGDNEDSNYVRAVHNLQAFYQSLGIKLKTDLMFPFKGVNNG